MDSILPLDPSVLRVVIPPQGPDVREYVNEHRLWPRPDNFDTVWWRAHDGTLHLEWRTPRPSAKVYIYGGGEAALRESRDSLVGHTTPFRDAGGWRTIPIALEASPSAATLRKYAGTYELYGGNQLVAVEGALSRLTSTAMGTFSSTRIAGIDLLQRTMACSSSSRRRAMSYDSMRRRAVWSA